MVLYGQVSTFDNGDDWTQYIERLDYYFVANGIEDATKRRAILLSVVGANTYRLIRNLVGPAKPDDKTYKELVDLMMKHQCPPPSETVQRFKLNTRMRQPNESVSTYVAELRPLIEFCGYPAGEQTNKMLRDRLVCGINNSAIQKKLLSVKDLDFEKALEFALALETAEENARTLQQPRQKLVHKVDSKPGPSKPDHAGEKQKTTACTRCGGKGHASYRCKFKTAKCFNCSKIGHIAAVCRSKPSKPRHVKALVKDEDENSDAYTIFSFPSTDDSGAGKPITVEMFLDD